MRASRAGPPALHRSLDAVVPMTTAELRRLARGALSPTLEEAGFTQQGRRTLWIRRNPNLVHVIGLSTVDSSAGLTFECGIWAPVLAALLLGQSSPRLRNLTMCHIRWGDCQLNSQHPLPPAGTVAAYLSQLDRIQTLGDVSAFLESDASRSWPASASICELYCAGIAVLTGSPTAFVRASAAAAHLVGAGVWSEAANRVYGAIATLE
jgi:hypothetical protein